MSCKPKSIVVHKGEGIHATLTWTDNNGPVDITGTTMSITEAHPEALTGGTVEAVEPFLGQARIDIPAILLAEMFPGSGNYIRLGLLQDNGRWKVSPRIPVERK